MRLRARPGRRTRLPAALLVGVGTLTLGVPAVVGVGPVTAAGPPAVTAPLAAPATSGCARPAGVHTDGIPWAQALLAPQRVWPLSDGSGVRVAVLGTGVDVGNAQFRRGQVQPGVDVTVKAGRANNDCDGRGTFAAGLIGAQPDDATTFAGMAPGVTILPVRYTQSTSQGNNVVNPDLLARAIDVAVNAKAKVICVVVPAATATAKLRAAVARAVASDVVVVSAAVASGPGQGGASYPTALPGVLGVGAFGPDAAAVTNQTSDRILVSAPGKALLSLAAGAGGKLGHTKPVDDPAYASAFVAGTAALVRAYRPDLDAGEVVARIRQTAARTAMNDRHPQLGWGMVDPYRAVAAQGLDTSPAATAPAPVAVAPPPVASGWDRRIPPLVLAGLATALGVGIGRAVVRRGRARGWRPGP